MYNRQHIHFVGIGGIGMSGLARVLNRLGNELTGSDVKESDITKDLRKKGIVVHIGHDASQIEGADVVVVSSAIRQDNPEIVAARHKGIPVMKRADMLADLMRLKKYCIAVAGAHGKTTTTSMVYSVLKYGHRDPTVIIGGKVNGDNTNAHWSKGEYLVAEADESDGSFLRLSPTVAVVTNIDREHLDYYKDISHIKDAFRQFIDSIPFYGRAVICGDDQNLLDISEKVERPVIKYGTSQNLDMVAVNIKPLAFGTKYEAIWKGNSLGEIKLALPGKHNILNSLAALAVGMELEIPFEHIRQGLESARGVDRRFQTYYSRQDVIIVDDYAHHPTEIRATIETAKACWPRRRLVVLFEPHRYSRTMALKDEFCKCFELADLLWITDIYPASEDVIPGISAQSLTKSIFDSGVNAQYIQIDKLAEKALSLIRPGDVVLTLGAGYMGMISRRLRKLIIPDSSVMAA